MSVVEAAVWCDRMPGSPPRTHAVLRCLFLNSGEDTMIVFPGEGVIMDARTNLPLRRFSCSLVEQDRETPRSILLPNEGKELTFRTPRQRVMPFDIDARDLVRFHVTAPTSQEGGIHVVSDTIHPFLTQ